ncbi:MAG: hypothetical protein KIT45_12855 [Fimbriimonadia bacterium]|nr:hypothetical protein [Fimbriimonadia bacterium]
MATGQSLPNIVKLTNIVVDDKRGRAYFAGSLSRHIGVIDTLSFQMVDAIDTGVNGFTFKFLRINPTTGVLYMFVLETGRLYRIDPFGRVVSPPISVQRSPVIDPVSNRLYITEMPDKIRIYDENMQLQQSIQGLTDPGELFVDAESNRLYMLHTVPPPRAGVSVFNLTTKAFIRRYNMPIGFDGLPKSLYVGNGKIYVTSNSFRNSLSILDVDTGNGILIPLTESGGPMELYQGQLYQMTGFPFYPGYLPQADGAYGILEARNAMTGQKNWDLLTDFETTYFDIDSSSGRMFYTATGNGVIGVLDLGTRNRIGEIDVTTTIEDVLVHPTDGSLYLRNRLGGSEIYRLNPVQREITHVLQPGKWPTKIILDEGRNQIYALSHYEAKVSVFSLTTHQKVRDIVLQTQRARTDALSTMCLNRTTGFLYVIMPESGTFTKISAEGSSEPTTITIPNFDPTRARGPGELHIAVNELLNRVYLFHRQTKRLQIYNGDSLHLMSSSTIQEFNQPISPLDLLYCDEARGRLFVGPQIVNAQTGTLIGRLPQGLKVIGAKPDGSRHYVLDQLSPPFRERVIEYDPDFHTVFQQWEFAPIQGIFSAIGFDFSRNRLYVGYFERGDLGVHRLGRRGDANYDGCVNDLDLLAVLFVFGGISLDADLNLDGEVNDLDLLEALFHFGEGC